MSEDELLAERLKNLQMAVADVRAELDGYKKNGVRAILAVAGYLAWVALHNIPAFAGFFE